MSTPEELMGKYVKALNSGDWYGVIEHTTEIIKKNPKLAHVWANRAAALCHLGQDVDAILNIDKAIELEPSASHLSNKGCCYWNMGDDVTGLKYLLEAEAMDPIAQTLLTIGNIYKYRKNDRKALEYYKKATEIDPDYADGHLCYAMLLLKLGQFQEGWEEYEWRWKTSQLPPRKLKCPQWQGQNLSGKSILVYGEQGLGDMIQFARYGRQLANMYPKAKVILEVKPHIRRLIEKTDDVYAVITSGDKLPDLDYAVPMMTLAGMMTPNINSIRSLVKEFNLNKNDIENWRERIEALPVTDGIRIGVCWAGMSRPDNLHADAVDKQRSTSLEKMQPLFEIPGILWVNLQKGPPAQQMKPAFTKMRPLLPENFAIVDMTDDMIDFYDTACVMANCDLVISVDTSVIHASASIGTPTWLLSRWSGCWRWFGDDRQDSPWYPTLRQFGQPSPHDWDGLMKEVAVELRKFVNSKTQPELDLTNNLSYLRA